MAERVLVLHNQPVLPHDHHDYVSEQEVLETAEAVARHLTEARFDVARLGISRDPGALVSGLRDIRPEVVFNLFEGTADDGSTECCAAGILEWLRIPFTGSSAQALCVARNKYMTKQMLRGAGLPTPDFFLVEALPPPPCSLDWPVIVKPALQDASVGVDQGSVVTSAKLLERRVAHLLETYGPPVLVEAYVEGRELSVALIEAPQLMTLPVSEISFVEDGPGYWPIVTYDAKWKPGSAEYEATPPHYPADIPAELGQRLAELSRAAYQLLGLRDYGRVDFRVRPTGQPFILEVNPNPCLSPDAGLAGGLDAVGLTHRHLMVQLVRNALGRKYSN